jgi:hypothetical protein
VTVFDGPADGFSDNPLLPEESLDDQETGGDLDEGYSPPERPWGLSAWGTTADEAAGRESLSSRLPHEQPEPGEEFPGDGIGDVPDAVGELVGDQQVGDLRAGRLVLGDVDELDTRSDYWASDVGIDGGAASAEEAAVHIIIPDDQER